MGSFYGRLFRCATFGESHGPAVGVIVEGAPAGMQLTAKHVQDELDKRRPGLNLYVSQRVEDDRVEILSGVVDERTIGSPIAMIVKNTGQRSEDYKSIAHLFRPGHADYTYFKKYGIAPQPGGGRASGRETVGRVAAGAVAKRILEEELGAHVAAYTIQIGSVKVREIHPDYALKHSLRCADPACAEAMEAEVKRVAAHGDSIGGILEIIATGVPAGLGEPVFEKLDARLAASLLSIGGVKGIEFGDGFRAATKRGSEHNDQMTEAGFLSNHCGGILGGISTGQPIVMRLAVKPTASISQPQKTIDVHGLASRISVKGRHDPCLCPRIAPVAEAMTALTLVDAWLVHKAAQGIPR
ncbi:MAG: chorismate synthase [Desulfomonilaceae bacterium]